MISHTHFPTQQDIRHAITNLESDDLYLHLYNLYKHT